MANRRRNSYAEIAVNPLESTSTNGIPNEHKFELLTTSIPINSEQFTELLSQVQQQSDSSEILKILSIQKNGYLFSSMELIRLLDCIPSKKTQIAVIEMIGPRLTDPKKCSNEILNRFRFAEEKQTVQDILKARAVTQNSGLYATKKPLGGPGRHSPKKKTNEIPATHQHSTTDLQSESDQSKPQEVVHLVPEMQFVSVTQDVPSIDDCNITIEITSPEISKYEESTSSLQGRETGSAVTTNEDLDNMIADREEIKLCERSTCLENSAPENLREVEQPDLVGSRNEYATPLDSNSSVPVTTPPLDIVKKIDESSRSDPNIHLYHDSPVINVVPKTRMLSIHHANVSRHGSENEFLTQTDEFSFDERFHSTSAFVEEPRIPTEPPSKSVYESILNKLPFARK